MNLQSALGLGRLYTRWRLERYKKQGLQIEDDLRIAGMPFFGSEPYLISIGKKVTLSHNVTFVTHDGATSVFRDQEPYRQVRKFGRIVIRENCFIGCGAILMPGISVGPNSIVAAGAIVYADVPPDTIVWGNPARPLMKVDIYAEQSALKNAEWNEENYRVNKKAEILRLFPRPW